jgi:heme/copper-type cytochrome/quinol oxidase subunit 4
MIQTLILLIRPALIGGIALFGFGYLWYSIIFKNHFAKLRAEEGKTKETPSKEQMLKTHGIKFVLDVLTAAAFSIVCYPDAPYKVTLVMFFIVWIGFTLPQIMSAYLWDKRSGKYTAFEIVFSISSFLLLAIVTRFVFLYLI